MPRAKKTPAAKSTEPVVVDAIKSTGSDTKFRISARAQHFLDGKVRSSGASCNVFTLTDDRFSIAESLSWAAHVGFNQGAPSIDMSQLRPEGSPVSGGGDAGGLTLMKAYDSLAGYVRRELKKNGAMAVYLDYDHPSLDYFLDLEVDFLTKAVYVPTDASSTNLDKKLKAKLVDAYNKGKIFIVKRPSPGMNGEALFCNLCTEVEIPHRGTCVLGAVNLGQFDNENLDSLISVFSAAAQKLYVITQQTIQANAPTLWSCSSPNNVQFGLGVTGLASMLANLSISYEDFTTEMDLATTNTTSLEEIIHNASSRSNNNAAAELVWYFACAYHAATNTVKDKVVKAFCIQPSSTGAFALADKLGFTVSPEIQPVQGMRVETNEGTTVRTIRKSTKSGDLVVDFRPGTETINDVPYETYAKLCSAWQRLMNSTGLAHRHSANFYGETFTQSDLDAFLDSDRKSLYYRILPTTPGVDKTASGVDASDLVDFDPSTMLGLSCSYQDSDCTECAG